MSIDVTQVKCPVDVVARLGGVTLTATAPYDVGMDGVDLVLRRGELALVLLEKGSWSHPLADVLSGLVPVDQGDVEVFGWSWDRLSPDRQAGARWRIGRVFERKGWMSNLDVDENITLAERHHTQREEREILEEALALARLAGLDPWPTSRPAVVGREVLRRAEWVRAALGSPWLMLLERPGRDLARGWRTACVRLVERARAGGAAVLWLCEDEEEWNDRAINPSLKLRAEGNTLRPDA